MQPSWNPFNHSCLRESFMGLIIKMVTNPWNLSRCCTELQGFLAVWPNTSPLQSPQLHSSTWERLPESLQPLLGTAVLHCPGKVSGSGHGLPAGSTQLQPLAAHMLSTGALLWPCSRSWTSLLREISASFFRETKCMVKSTAAAGNEPLGTSPERKHVTADNVMDAPDQMSEGAAKRNTAVVTTGCRILSHPILQQTAGSNWQHTAHRKAYLQGNCKPEPPGSETRTYQKYKYLAEVVSAKMYLAPVQLLRSHLSSFQF